MVNTWGIVEWSALAGILMTIIGSGLASYVGVLKSNISTKKDIDNGFERLREIEKNTSEEIQSLQVRLNNKSIRIETLEKMLYDYLKKHEAETLYCKKETMQPVIDNLIKNQEMLYTDLKEFRKEIKGSMESIVNGLNRHIDEDRNFQKDLINTLTNLMRVKEHT